MSDQIPKGVTLNLFGPSKDGKIHIKVYKDSIIHRVDFEFPSFAAIEHQPGYWQPKEKEQANEQD